MAKVYSVVNKKGGVGKSTTISAIASISANYGLRVLIVDLDPQINTTSIFYKNDYPDKTITDLLINPQNEITYDYVKNIIKPTDYKNIDIIPGDIDLDEQGDILLIKNAYQDSRGQIEINKEAQMLLQKAFKIIDEDYDIILIDNSPHFNIISKNALSASNGVLIPIENDGFSYHGLTGLLNKIYEIKGGLNDELEIIGVFFTNVNRRTNLFKQLRDLFKEDLGDKLLDAYIRHDNKVKESNTALIPLYDYAPKANATIDYAKLILELNILDEKNKNQLIKDIKKHI